MDRRGADVMIDGLAQQRVSGHPIATFTSCGPGSVNIVMAIAGAMFDSSAMLAITGNVPTSQFNRGPFQESGKYFQGDFPSVIRSYVKRSFQAVRPEMLPLMLDQAFALMTSGRPGPVNIDFSSAMPATTPPATRNTIHLLRSSISLITGSSRGKWHCQLPLYAETHASCAESGSQIAARNSPSHCAAQPTVNSEFFRLAEFPQAGPSRAPEIGKHDEVA